MKKLYDKGEKAYLKKDYQSAKDRLIEFISIPLPVSDTTWWSDPGYYYVRLKNQACGYLKQVYFDEKNFKEALQFHLLQKSKYPIVSPGCFWNVMGRRYEMDIFESKCYEELGDYDNAISCLMFYWNFYNVNERFVDLAVKKIGFDSLKKELEKSIDSILLKDNKFSITLLGFDLGISFLQPIIKYEYDKEKEFIVNGNDTEYIAVRPIVIPRTEEQIEEEKIKVKEAFKQSKFYKLIMEK